MSWGLFVHNTPLVPSEFVAPDGSDIPATTVFTGTPDFAGSVEGMFAVAPEGRIMALPAGVEATAVMYSDDYGSTWTETGTLPDPGDANTWVVTRLLYSAYHDAWFAHTRPGNFTSTIIYSEDNGATWVDMGLDLDTSIEHPCRYTNRNFVLDDAGALYVAGRTPDYNGIEVHKYPDPTGVGRSSYTSIEVASNSNLGNIQLVGENLILHVLVPYSTDNRARAYIVPTDLSSFSHLCDLSEDETSPSRDFSSYPWVSGGDLVLALGSDLSPATSSSAAYSPLTADISTIWPPPTETYSVGEDCQEPYSAGYGNGHFLFGHRPTADLDRYVLDHSLDGYTWTLQSDLNLDASRDSGNTASMLRHLEGSTWILSIVSSNKMKLLTFQYGELSAPAPPRSALSLGIRRQSPDIFMMLDDTGSPSSVTDIGSKGYTNVTDGAITFEQSGLVDDGGTAALFGGGNITVDVTSGAYEHAHVFILSHDDTASERTLLSFNGFTLKLDADDKVVFSDGSETITSSAVAADTATFVALHLEQISCGTKANLYVGTTHVGQELSELEPALAGDLVLGGSGVTIDYYAMIPSENADVAALQRAFGLSPSLPAAPTSALCGEVKLLVRADSSPLQRNFYNQEMGQWQSVYGVPNLATGAEDFHVGADSFADLTDGKFGSGSLVVPDRSYLGGVRPQNEPQWHGFGSLDIGVADFSLSAWVKPLDANQKNAYLASSLGYIRVGGKWAHWGGLFISLGSGGPGQGAIQIVVGGSLQSVMANRDNRYAFSAVYDGFPTYTANAWNFITVCRKDLRWYLTIGGRLHTRVRSQSGNAGSRIYPVPHRPMMFGAHPLVVSSGSLVGMYSTAAKIDDAVLVLGEALYTQEFTPPTNRFELS